MIELTLDSELLKAPITHAHFKALREFRDEVAAYFGSQWPNILSVYRGVLDGMMSGEGIGALPVAQKFASCAGSENGLLATILLAVAVEMESEASNG